MVSSAEEKVGIRGHNNGGLFKSEHTTPIAEIEAIKNQLSAQFEIMQKMMTKLERLEAIGISSAAPESAALNTMKHWESLRNSVSVTQSPRMVDVVLSTMRQEKTEKMQETIEPVPSQPVSQESPSPVHRASFRANILAAARVYKQSDTYAALKPIDEFRSLPRPTKRQPEIQPSGELHVADELPSRVVDLDSNGDRLSSRDSAQLLVDYNELEAQNESERPPTPPSREHSRRSTSHSKRRSSGQRQLSAREINELEAQNESERPPTPPSREHSRRSTSHSKRRSSGQRQLSARESGQPQSSGYDSSYRHATTDSHSDYEP